MNRRKRPKFRSDRRIGENIWASRRSSFNKREYGPVQHGNKLKKKITDYGIRLLAKPRDKGLLSNSTESEFKRVCLRPLQLKGNVALNIVCLLGIRLDVLVYRAGLPLSGHPTNLLTMVS